MLFKIAWRNIWRSRTRSLVVMGAIAVGVWSVIFLISFSSGMVDSYVRNAIENEVSHLQAHHPEFPRDEEVHFLLGATPEDLQQIERLPGVEAATLRTIVQAMISSGKTTTGARVRGIDPEREHRVTHLDEKVVEGEYLDAPRRNALLVSTRLAEKLKVRLRSRVVLTFQDLEGNITAGAFRVVGLFDTGNNAFDESTVFVRQSDLNRLLARPDANHELAVKLREIAFVDSVQSAIQALHPGWLVENYAQIAPEIELFQSQIKLSALIFTVVVMLGLIFGIINTMLMAVLERVRELGMLMAIGMNKPRVFAMVVLETLFLGLAAAPAGLLLGWLTVRILGRTGIDLSAWSAGVREFGMSAVVYPSLQGQVYGLLIVAVLVTALLGALYPALKAIRLRPVEALRKI
ncbi:MAG: ABC transporter permease [Bacteroidetes bacterium]|nr:MAG: ABC transporter permease [Bacteroidota bacterium]